MHISMQMEYIDLSVAAKEIAHYALNKNFSKSRIISENCYILKFSQVSLISYLPYGICVLKHSIKNPQGSTSINMHSNSICNAIDKHIKNAKLTDVYVEDSDRILWLIFGNYAIVLEYLRPGNIILLESKHIESGKNTDSIRHWYIVDAAHKRRWRTREIIPGSEYILPPKRMQPVSSLLRLNFDEFKKLILSSNMKNTPLMSFLMKYAFGKRYYMHILNLLDGIIKDSTPVGDISKDVWIRFITELRRFYNNIPLSIYSVLGSDSVSDFFSKIYIQHILTDPVLDKLKDRLEKQKAYLKSLTKEYETLRKTGDYIYEHYSTIDYILNTIRTKPKDMEILSKYKVKIINGEELEADV